MILSKPGFGNCNYCIPLCILHFDRIRLIKLCPTISTIIMKIYFLNGTSHWTIPSIIAGSCFFLIIYIYTNYDELFQKIKNWFK